MRSAGGGGFRAGNVTFVNIFEAGWVSWAPFFYFQGLWYWSFLFFFFQSYGSFQSARSFRRMSLFFLFTLPSNLLLLVSFLILVYVCSLYCSARAMSSFSKPPVTPFCASLLMCFLAGFNHSMDHGYPSVAWTESGCVSEDGLIPLLLFWWRKQLKEIVQILYRLNMDWQAVYNWYILIMVGSWYCFVLSWLTRLIQECLC